MKTHLLSGNAKRVLSSMLICCLWVCAVPAAARAQAKFSSVTCAYSVVINRMPQYYLKGTAQVTGLNPQNASTTVKFTFQTSKQAGQWSDLFDVSITTTGVNGTANFDTGWQGTGPPVKGQQYQVVVSGFYVDGTGKQVLIPGTTSDPITPNP